MQKTFDANSRMSNIMLTHKKMNLECRKSDTWFMNVGTFIIRLKNLGFYVLKKQLSLLSPPQCGGWEYLLEHMDFSKCDEVSCIRVMNSFCCARLICIKRHAISIPQFLLRSGNRANASMGLFYITSNETQVLFLVDITEHICNKADIKQKRKKKKNWPDIYRRQHCVV